MAGEHANNTRKASVACNTPPRRNMREHEGNKKGTKKTLHDESTELKKLEGTRVGGGGEGNEEGTRGT